MGSYQKATAEVEHFVQEVYKDVLDYEVLTGRKLDLSVDEINDAEIEYYFLDGKCPFEGKCQKATGVFEVMTNKDYVIILHKEFWDGATILEKKGLLFHELLHVVRLNEKWKVRKHDREILFSEVELYGDWDQGLQLLEGAKANHLEYNTLKEKNSV